MQAEEGKDESALVHCDFKLPVGQEHGADRRLENLKFEIPNRVMD